MLLLTKLSIGSNISQEVPKHSDIQIVAVALICISFPFKRDIPICFVMIEVQEKPDDIFKYIPYIKWYNKKFGLLAQMDALMIY